MGKKKYLWINILKCIAACCIINSHCTNLWPNSNLAVGGAIGNAIFFCCSGYLGINIKDSFKKYIEKKIIRLYIPLWIVNIIWIIIGNINITSPSDFWYAFIWPKEYWFIQAILVSFVIYYFILKQNNTYNALRLAIGISLILYIIGYLFLIRDMAFDVEGTSKFKWIFYFICMLIGANIRINEEKNCEYSIKKPMASVLLFLVIYVSIKVLTGQYIYMHYIQSISQIATGGVAISLLVLLRNIPLNVEKNKLVVQLINLIGASTLEVYLVNYVIIHNSRQFDFPINIMIAFSIIFFVGSALHYISNYITTILIRKM